MLHMTIHQAGDEIVNIFIYQNAQDQFENINCTFFAFFLNTVIRSLILFEQYVFQEHKPQKIG